MKLGIVIYSNEPETVWNAFRFGNFSLAMGDTVSAFLIGKGVESELTDTAQFKVTEQIDEFLKNKGKIFVCGTCLNMRKKKAPEMFAVSTLKELYGIVTESDKVVSF